ncbi:acyl-CoA thioesterase [Parapedobacter sp. ISTM3]|uniref:Acyl-CoA thioester hydrolase n=1 Tax=Parapedobacter luteus TaxID=623280 RepID=A0A1T5AGF9_9SPHI|nr:MULTISPECIES: thioesterase family protein [Parapedobacter]MBK1441834.1 acyl-CoA thioesterase [Parapedobacter sp. ISTM3]SKB34091.1 acyl-CoA thioester hydrolase [Parapedobacter luteus]
MYTFETKVRVRYAETDQMGYVYYGNYATFYEVGRVELFRSLGFSYKALEDSGIMLPVLELHSRFIKPARYDEELTVRVSLKEKPAIKIRFDYELFNSEGELLNTGTTTLVFVNIKRNKPCMAPPEFLDHLQRYFP